MTDLDKIRKLLNQDWIDDESRFLTELLVELAIDRNNHLEKLRGQSEHICIHLSLLVYSKKILKRTNYESNHWITEISTAIYNFIKRKSKSGSLKREEYYNRLFIDNTEDLDDYFVLIKDKFEEEKFIKYKETIPDTILAIMIGYLKRICNKLIDEIIMIPIRDKELIREKVELIIKQVLN